MRKFFLFLIALTMITVASTNNADAARRRIFRSGRVRQMRTVNNNGNIFSRLMELERRKNQWLFGR